MRRLQGPGAPDREDGTAGGALEPHDLTALFVAPRWLRDLGTSAWAAVGVTLLLVGVVWILSLTAAIVTPVITAAVVAAVSGPLVGVLERRGCGAGWGRRSCSSDSS